MHDYLNHSTHNKAPSEMKQQMEHSLLHSCLKTLKEDENENYVISYQVRAAEAPWSAPQRRLWEQRLFQHPVFFDATWVILARNPSASVPLVSANSPS